MTGRVRRALAGAVIVVATAPVLVAGTAPATLAAYRCRWVSSVIVCYDSPVAQGGCEASVGYCSGSGSCTVSVGTCEDGGSCVVNVGRCEDSRLIGGI